MIFNDRIVRSAKAALVSLIEECTRIPTATQNILGAPTNSVPL